MATIAKQYSAHRFSPQSAPWLWSLFVHVLVAGSTVLLMNLNGNSKAVDDSYIDLSMETFDAPPAPEKVVHKVQRSPEPVAPEVTKAPPIDTAKELQDEKSDVAGTQKEAKPQASAGSESDGNAASTPYYKIKPKYPRAALLEGIEGWVMLEVDITEAGTVENVRVIDGEQRNMFQTEARRAVEQYKYRPFLDSNGKPTRKVAHHIRVEFKIEEAEAQSRN
jgi:protein TonB